MCTVDSCYHDGISTIQSWSHKSMYQFFTCLVWYAFSDPAYVSQMKMGSFAYSCDLVVHCYGIIKKYSNVSDGCGWLIVCSINSKTVQWDGIAIKPWWHERNLSFLIIQLAFSTETFYCVYWMKDLTECF